MTAFVTVMATALILTTGLVVDGGRALAARLQAGDLAQEAARAGAQQLDLGPYRRAGQVTVDPARARSAARDYLTRAGWPGTATVSATGATVTVVLRSAQPGTLLRLAGVTSIAVTGTATATAIRGLAAPRTVPRTTAAAR